MEKAFRISLLARVPSAFNGEGASTFGGRWNSPGTRVVYLSASLSLAMLEVMVHLQDYSTLCKKFVYMEVEIPSELVVTPPTTDLPKGWDAVPLEAGSQRLGDLWVLERRSVALCVPSVLASGERNYVLNPQHPDFSRIAISNPQSICFDPRLIK